MSTIAHTFLNPAISTKYIPATTFSNTALTKPKISLDAKNYSTIMEKGKYIYIIDMKSLDLATSVRALFNSATNDTQIDFPQIIDAIGQANKRNIEFDRLVVYTA